MAPDCPQFRFGTPRGGSGAKLALAGFRIRRFGPSKDQLSKIEDYLADNICMFNIIWLNSQEQEENGRVAD